MSASSEFVALCQSQVALLTQGLGASLSAVYLTEVLVEGTEAKLVPIVAYPETSSVWQDQAFALLPAETEATNNPGLRLLSAAQPLHSLNSSEADAQASPSSPELSGETFAFGETGRSPSAQGESNFLMQQRQIVLPLMHEGVMLGLLVTGREDRPWNEWERAQIERIAHTIALACILNQRSQWLEQERQQQQQLQAQQHDLLDNLLHQFRNPLTALRTFGKLLLRRLRPTDVNRDVATSIIRESDRLQELLQQFDQALDLGEVSLEPFTLGPTHTAIDVAPDVQPALQSPTPPEEVPCYSPRSIPLLPASGFLAGINLNLEPCSVAAVLEPLIISAQAIAQERSLQLQTEIPANLSLVRANVRALREVLSNLIDNALKYTPAGGTISIQVQDSYLLPSNTTQQATDRPYQAIAVSDTGPGIPPQDLPHIFERHYRGVQAATEIPGTGLGLAIARDLVEQMQGEIQVFSPAQSSGLVSFEPTATSGPGTSFVLWLPLESP